MKWYAYSNLCKNEYSNKHTYSDCVRYYNMKMIRAFLLYICMVADINIESVKMTTGMHAEVAEKGVEILFVCDFNE